MNDFVARRESIIKRIQEVSHEPLSVILKKSGIKTQYDQLRFTDLRTCDLIGCYLGVSPAWLHFGEGRPDDWCEGLDEIGLRIVGLMLDYQDTHDDNKGKNTIAAGIGISYTTYHGYLYEGNIPSHDRLLMIAHFHHVSPGWLAYGAHVKKNR